MGTFTANSPSLGEDDMERRSLLRLLSVLGPVAAIPTFTPGELPRISAEPTDRDVDDWERVAWDYAQSVWIDLSGSRSANLVADIRDLSKQLARTTGTSERASLLRVYAQLSAFLALDLPLIAGARACWRAWAAARTAADASGDRDLAVWVRAEEAVESYYMQRVRTATENLLDEAVQLAGNHPSLGLAQAQKIRARVLAEDGRVEEARAALREFKDTYSALPSTVTDERISVWGLASAEAKSGEAWTLAKLGDAKAAAPLLEQALADLPEEKVGGRANIGLLQAWCLIQDHEVTEGLGHAVRVTQSLPVTPPRRRLVGEVLTALPDKARELPAARELRALVTPAAA
ncbi:hypothetical protein GCM10010106_16620 [Thermopolyspora flexuosa]|nr:hypothetical protein [Thermopolyspora flexuosa]GGM70988.1 hypothetical protein GCM10010106_16620 [Thermopolyspora flexuosa]